jgi:hypothetical protein
MNARELFEKAGWNACVVAVRGPDVHVSYPGGSWLMSAAEWERYKALCAQWRAAGMDVQPVSVPAPVAVLECVRRELARLQTDMAAAGTCLSVDDVADALVSFMRTVQGCEASVAQVLEGLRGGAVSDKSDGSDKSDESDGKEVAP